MKKPGKNSKPASTSGTSAIPAVTLYHYWRSSASWRVRWALAIKEIPYKKVAVNLLKNEQKSPDYLRINPAGQVPTLVYDDEQFTESLAILEFLEEKHPQHALLPNDASSRLFVRQLALVVVANTQPLQNLLPMTMHSDDPAKRKAWAQFFITRGLEIYEKRIQQTAGSFSFGSQLTIADLCLIPQVYNAKRFEVSLDPFPKVAKIFDHCMKLESCKAAAPESQEDAVKG